MIEFDLDQAPPSRLAYSSSIASSYRRSASISAAVFSRVVPAPVLTPAPVALELGLLVCDCSVTDESTFVSEPEAGACETSGSLERKGMVIIVCVCYSRMELFIVSLREMGFLVVLRKDSQSIGS